MNKAGIYIYSQPFSALHWERTNEHGCTLEKLKFEKEKEKKKYLYCKNIDRATVRQPAKDICRFTFWDNLSRRLVSLLIIARWVAQICRNLVSLLLRARWVAQVCQNLASLLITAHWLAQICQEFVG